jgi:hypothetical protein
VDRTLFERNLLALSLRDGCLCSRLTAAQTTLGRYRFLDSRSGETVPALADPAGAARPLHSLVDPRREGARLLGSLAPAEGFLVFLGLGGGYYQEAALERQDTQQVLVVEYDINGTAELLASKEYIGLFNDPRFCLLVDPSPSALEEHLLGSWQPVLQGGIRVIPLRPRVDGESGRFALAGEAIKKAIDRLSADYSVQAYFGRRWFSNIIRNVFLAEKSKKPLPPIKKAAICAAGPSLDRQLSLLAEPDEKRFIIACDTALPALLKNALTPDAVVSIDCQHISYYHFMWGLPPHIPLFLDLASPPLLGSLSSNFRFFSGGHPLTRYISRYWRSFPELDTSGANVAYAALSLADYLGAEDIKLYGADFSYPLGRTYARGTYLNPYFACRQNRLSPLEALSSAFLYRNTAMEKAPGAGWYYETAVLKSYREGIEAKARSIKATVSSAEGLGAPISLPRGGEKKAALPSNTIRLFSAGKAGADAASFLKQYRSGIKALPKASGSMARYLRTLDEEERRILTTLLPAGAAIKRQKPELNGAAVLEAVKAYSLKELDAVLK